MRYSRARFVFPVVVIAVVVGLVLWRSREQNTSPATELYGNGIIETREVTISAKVAGNITSLRVDEGDPVERGMTIVELDSASERGCMPGQMPGQRVTAVVHKSVLRLSAACLSRPESHLKAIG